MKCIQDIYEAIENGGFTASTLQSIDEFEKMDQQTFLDLINKSILDSARQARLLLGRPSSRATLQEALQQVAMLEAARMSQAAGK